MAYNNKRRKQCIFIFKVEIIYYINNINPRVVNHEYVGEYFFQINIHLALVVREEHVTCMQRFKYNFKGYANCYQKCGTLLDVSCQNAVVVNF